MAATPLTQLDHIAGNTIIQFTDTDPALLSVDAFVEEQDTNLLLGNSPIVSVVIDSFPKLVEKMSQLTGEKPGDVLIKSTSPLHMIAVVYDIDNEPICEENWLESAFISVLEHCQEYKIPRLAMPLLGTSYGKLTEDDVFELLQYVLINNRQPFLKKILIYHLPRH